MHVVERRVLGNKYNIYMLIKDTHYCRHLTVFVTNYKLS